MQKICEQVLCSVPDVTAAVKEMRRVLKPGGRAFFLEHVFADKSRRVLQVAQQILSPAQQLLADGCHLNRFISSLLLNSGCLHLAQLDQTFFH